MTASTYLLAPPEVPAALADIPGGEPNLLPIAALEGPLRVEIPMWLISDPQPGFPERLEVYWNGVVFHEDEWTAAVPPADLLLNVQDLHQQHGSHSVYYRVMISTGVWGDSEEIELTVDRVPPTLGGNGGRLGFDTTEVTAEYLEQNGDELIGQVPDYNTLRPGDVISWYWDTRFEEDQRVNTRTLTEDDVGKTLELVFDGNTIRALGDGTRMARYRVLDRAGNASSYASYVNLEVSAHQPEREFGWPNIKNATGTGAKVSLDPLKTTQGGATVEVPASAQIRDDDVVWVQWGERGAPGSFRSDVIVSPGVYHFVVPKEYVAFHIGRTLGVQYEVTDALGREYVSAPRQVEVLKIAPENFTNVQCEGVSGSGSLSLAAVPATGAKLTLAPWVMISADQWITIKVEGLSASGTGVMHTVIDKRQLSAAEVSDGIGKDGLTVIPKTFLAGLKLDTDFNVQVTVSFNQGQNWPSTPNFRRLYVELTP